ncbi:hypothetical protein ACFPK9_12915 [Rubritalea spongiae]|uniref:Uncharacterized protein n=1 Tax=Rubritalea spongiae TaxID=430797 RepID=A0ABW5E5C0_9BACT
MRIFSLIFLLGALRLCAATELPAPTEFNSTPIQKKVLKRLHSHHGKEAAEQFFKTLGIDEISKVEQSNLLLDGTWLSQVTILREHTGMFSLLDDAQNIPFFAPESTDIAVQVTINLETLSELIQQYHTLIGSNTQANSILDQKIANSSLHDLLASPKTTFHLCIDFDENKELFLGKESIGYPHFAFRIDGNHALFESILLHYIKTRNALFTQTKTKSQTTYSLPTYFADAIAGYVPNIEFDTEHDSTTIVSSAHMLERLHSESASLNNDPYFTKTWQNLPTSSSAKAYISKRALEGFQRFYLLAIKEKWTDHPAFLQKKFQITAAVAQLNSSDSGLAIAISSDKNKDTIINKSPFPSNFLLWLLQNSL